ncbi:MAG: acyltransferase [Muribaculaceae bacterium]|nr:acyltransferase [Muribaculaceae bacterium]
MHQQRSFLSRAECYMLKAIAIVMIMAHNFAHMIPGTVQENEYGFSAERTMQLLHALANPDWQLPLHLLSFFGHYGVPLFLLLSGYGLVMKYERDGHAGMGSPWAFVAQHYGKLLRLMLLGLIAFLAIYHFTHHPISKWNVAAQLTMVVNLLSEPWARIKPGPYWFFGLMMQVYVVYRLVLYAPPGARRWRWLGPVLLMVLCHVAQEAGWLVGGDKLVYWMRYNLLVAGLPLGMGLLAGRYCSALQLRKGLGWAAVLLFAALTTVMNLNSHAWLLAPLAVMAGGVALVRILPQCTHKVLIWVGGLSPMLFVVHPIVRQLLIKQAQASHPYLWLLAYLALSVLAAVAYQWLLQQPWLKAGTTSN